MFPLSPRVLRQPTAQLLLRYMIFYFKEHVMGGWGGDNTKQMCCSATWSSWFSPLVEDGVSKETGSSFVLCAGDNAAESVASVSKGQLRRMNLMRFSATDKIEHRNVLCAHYLNKEPGLLRVLSALKMHRQKAVAGLMSLGNCFKKLFWVFLTPDIQKGVKWPKGVKIVEKPCYCHAFAPLTCFCPTPTSIFACSWIGQKQDDENSMTLPVVLMTHNIKCHWWIHTCANCQRKYPEKNPFWRKLTDNCGMCWQRKKQWKTEWNHMFRQYTYDVITLFSYRIT